MNGIIEIIIAKQSPCIASMPRCEKLKSPCLCGEMPGPGYIGLMGLLG